MSSHVVVNYHLIPNIIMKLCEKIENLSNEDKTWIERIVKNEAIKELGWLQIYPPTQDDLKSEHIKQAVKNNEYIYEFIGNTELSSNLSEIYDWICMLKLENDRFYKKLKKLNWKQTKEHTKKWHATILKKSLKKKASYTRDDENCPIVISYENGWTWVWVKTTRARREEGETMGHCVGSGGYENLNHNSAILSLRDEENNPHITIEIDSFQILQAVMKGNAKVNEKYKEKIEDVIELTSLSLILNRHPLENISLKKYERNTTKNGEVWKLKENDDRYPSEIELKKFMLTHIGHNRFESKFFKTNEDDAYKVIWDTIQWKNKNGLHRKNGPAKIDARSNQFWFVDGNRHREDGPAIIWTNGTEEWWLNGQLHRENGPAKFSNKKGMTFEEWYFNGELHRDDGPAVTHENGDVEWYKNGKRHREDGPAVEKKIAGEKTQEWWLNGVKSKKDGPAVLTSTGRHEWWLDGKKHREGGPAVESEGLEEWWKNGSLHREDGPAIIFKGWSLTDSGSNRPTILKKMEYWLEGKIVKKEKINFTSSSTESDDDENSVSPALIIDKKYSM